MIPLRGSSQACWSIGKRLGRLLRCGHDRAGGKSPMLVMDRVRHAAILPSAMTARSGPKQRSQNIQKNRCRTTVAEPIGETLAELPFTGDQAVCLGHDECRDETMIQLHGGPIVRVSCSLDEVLDWFT